MPTGTMQVAKQGQRILPLVLITIFLLVITKAKVVVAFRSSGSLSEPADLSIYLDPQHMEFLPKHNHHHLVVVFMSREMPPFTYMDLLYLIAM